MSLDKCSYRLARDLTPLLTPIFRWSGSGGEMYGKVFLGQEVR